MDRDIVNALHDLFKEESDATWGDVYEWLWCDPDSPRNSILRSRT